MKRKANETRKRKAARIAHRMIRFIIDIDPFDAYYQYHDDPEEYFECTFDCVYTDLGTAKYDTLNFINDLDPDDEYESKYYRWAASILEELEALETMTA